MIPAEGYLRYLKLEFWLGLLLFDGVVFVLWLVIFVNSPAAGLITSPFAFVIAVVPDIIAYVGIHVLYDTTWYIITPRSLRIRAGIWVLKEMTFTFENVQNVTINQGPLQRFFGIADVVVETAGGSAVAGPHGVGASAAHRGVLTGIDNADKIRSLIRERAGQSRTTVSATKRTLNPRRVNHGAAITSRHCARFAICLQLQGDAHESARNCANRGDFGALLRARGSDNATAFY